MGSGADQRKGTANAVLFLCVMAAAGVGAWMFLGAPESAGEPTAPAEDLVELRGEIMGTTYSVKAHSVASQDELRALVQTELEAVDASMSTYKPDSELSQLNAAPAAVGNRVSEPLMEVLNLAAQVHEASGGAFDPTVGPLVDAWGFGPMDVEAMPTDEDIAALKAHMGYDKLELSKVATKTDGELRVDLSAIAKGYAVDRVAETLDEFGVANYMVEVGGEVRARGQGPQGTWRIGIERPNYDPAKREIQQVVPLADMAMATSGDYRNYQEHAGQRVSHTIDPRTGRPVTHDLASVTVLHASCAMADAWATALSVLGPREGPEVAKKHDLAAYFVTRRAAGLHAVATPAFEAIVEKKPQDQR